MSNRPSANHVDHGPMMCPVCAATSREELGRDEGQR